MQAVPLPKTRATVTLWFVRSRRNSRNHLKPQGDATLSGLNQSLSVASSAEMSKLQPLTAVGGIWGKQTVLLQADTLPKPH
jgi:hypothetical protein